MENTAPNTNNFLNWVEIKNFKSIKDLRLDCKRVNVFIGKPNVGKSNILEGLGLLGAGYGVGKFAEGMIRYRFLRNLFYDNSRDSALRITTNYGQIVLAPAIIDNKDSYSFFDTFQSNETGALLTEEGELFEPFHSQTNQHGLQYSPVKKYDFTNLAAFNSSSSAFLLPPHGLNMYSVINRMDELWGEFAKLFENQNLEFVLSDYEQTFLLQKKQGSKVKQYPYFSIADTFRRFMFYITAIESNKNSVIVFEEPEVHSFPPYTQEMAYRMIYDEDNQYFISTHSPYMLHPFIEKMDYKDLNVFITYYKDYQTHVRALTEEELTDILDYSTNVFFNLRKFEPNA